MISLGLYTLPGDRASKFSLKNIKKFDLIDSHESDLAVDVDADTKPDCPNDTGNDDALDEEEQVPKWLLDDQAFPHVTYDQQYLLEYVQKIQEYRQRIEHSIHDSPLSAEVRLTLSKNGQKKTVVLTQRTMAALQKAIKQKYRNKAQKITMGTGEPVTNDQHLQTLQNDTLLLIV
jgi:hypothetical protein